MFEGAAGTGSAFVGAVRTPLELPEFGTELALAPELVPELEGPGASGAARPLPTRSLEV
jgi:hypothetical protein